MPHLHLTESSEPVADRLRLTLTCISEMRGIYPDIPLPLDIDRAALGDDAFFVTLPIGQAGAMSRNGRRYSRAAVEQMVAQINQHRPEGMWGHVAPDEVATRYDPPAMRWLAAHIDAEGIAWGKGLPLTEPTREYYRLAKATNARVGTSLVAWAQIDGDEVKALELVTVDLADPARVGVPVTAAHAHISKEMSASNPKEDTETNFTHVHTLPVGAQRAAPLSDLSISIADVGSQPGVLPPSPLRREGKQPQVAGVRSDDTTAHLATVLAEMLGTGDPITQLREILAERDALLDAAITSAVERAVHIPSALALVEELVRSRLASEHQPQTYAAVTEAVAAVVASASMQFLLRETLAHAMGPAQRRPIHRDGESGFFSF